MTSTLPSTPTRGAVLEGGTGRTPLQSLNLSENQHLARVNNDSQDSQEKNTRWSEDSPSMRGMNEPEPAKKKGNKAVSASKTASNNKNIAAAPDDAKEEFQISLTMSGTARSTASSSKKGRGRPAKEKEVTLLYLQDTISFQAFSHIVIDAAAEEGCGTPIYDKLQVKGRINAGGPWTSWMEIQGDKDFTSFTTKLRTRKREGFVMLTRSPEAVAPSIGAQNQAQERPNQGTSASASRHSVNSQKESDEEESDELDDEFEVLDVKKTSKTSKTKASTQSGKRKKNADDGESDFSGDAGRSKSKKKPKVKNEEEEDKAKLAADISRIHECADGTCSSSVCWIIRGGIHVPITNVLLDNWVASVYYDNRNNSTQRIPNNLTFDRACDIAAKKAKNRRRSSTSTQHALSEDEDEDRDHLLGEDDYGSDSDLPSLSQLASRPRRSAPSFSSNRSMSANRSNAQVKGKGVRRADPEAGPSRRHSVPPPAPTFGPDITFTALAARIKLCYALVTKMTAEGVVKATSFARLDETKLRAMGCLQGEVEEALDAQERWRKMSHDGIRAEELVDALIV